jgi:hypothetical protein
MSNASASIPSEVPFGKQLGLFQKVEKLLPMELQNAVFVKGVTLKHLFCLVPTNVAVTVFEGGPISRFGGISPIIEIPGVSRGSEIRTKISWLPVEIRSRARPTGGTGRERARLMVLEPAGPFDRFGQKVTRSERLPASAIFP